MLRLFSSILEWLQNLLGVFVDKPDQDSDDGFSNGDLVVVEKLPKKTSTRSPKENVAKWSQFAKTFALDRWEWIKRHPWFVGFIIVVIAIAYFSEGDSNTPPWWSEFWPGVQSWWQLAWQEHPVTMTLVLVLLFLLLFGIDWLRQLDNWLLGFWKWATRHRQISTTLGVLLIILIFYILSNANTWAFTSVEIWSEEELGQNGNQIAVQFRGNLNAIGTVSFETLTISVPTAPAIVTSAQSNLTPLSLDDCPQVMIGPKSFVALAGRSPVLLPRLSRAQADSGTAGQISLGTTLGDFNLPLQGLFRLIFSYTSPNYRELSAQIIPASRSSNSDDIRIIVTAIDGSRWAVEGPRNTLPQLINFLTYRIALDWKAQETGQPADEVKSADLALALGNEAYGAGDFDAALTYYRLAEWFRADSAIIEVMLGLTRLQLSNTAATETEKIKLLDQTSRAFNQAATLDPNNTDLFPYLACLHQQTGDTQRAIEKMESFNQTISPDNPDAKQKRITELVNKPPLGPGSRLSILQREAGFDLYYISDDAAQFTQNLPYNADLDQRQFGSITTGEAPRQIFAVPDGAYYVTPDGLVNFFRPGNPAAIIPVIDANSLQFSVSPNGDVTLGAALADDEPDQVINNMGGVRQVFADGNYLFVVDRFGRILRLNVIQSGTGGLDITPEAVTEVDAAQIYVDNALYVLKEDGTVWRISEPRTDDLKSIRQLVNDTDNREIVAADNVVYMLRTNGNIWRYLDGEGVEGDTLKRIDTGVGTSRIFITSQGLLALKKSGMTWLIRNPQNPVREDFRELDLPNTNRLAINAARTSLIALERPESKRLNPKMYQNILQASTSQSVDVAQAPVTIITPSPTSTAIPTSTPTPSPATATPPPAPTSTSTPSPTPVPTLSVEQESSGALASSNTISQTRAPDDAVEILISPPGDSAELFWIDQTEVTNQQYQACIEAGVCSENQAGYADLFYRQTHPVVGVNWQQAQTFCQWIGGSLPTVSQWRAAASPDGRPYPWGDAGPACQRAVINDACDTDPPGTRPVGSKPAGASPYGVLDLIGNVWEWTATIGNKDDARATIGGSWSNPDGTDEGGFNAFYPDTTISQGISRQVENLGFRCVRSFQPAAQ